MGEGRDHVKAAPIAMAAFWARLQFQVVPPGHTHAPSPGFLTIDESRGLVYVLAGDEPVLNALRRISHVRRTD